MGVPKIIQRTQANTKPSISSPINRREMLVRGDDFDDEKFGTSKHKGPLSSVNCKKCGVQIPEARIKAQPGARLCIHCASGDPNSNKKRLITEWGTRKDWMRDRSSWKRTH
jgi:hypothetical protein